MKKLTYLVSAVTAAFSATAHADIAVSGSGSASYLSNAANDGNVIVAGTTNFALSTTAANGMGISMSMGISQSDEVDGDNAKTDSDLTASYISGDQVTGGQAMTFTTGGATIVVGDIELGDTPGSVGGAVGGIVGDNSGLASNVASGFDDDDGTGISFSTAVGGATVTFGHIFDDATNNKGNIDATTAEAMSAASISMPMGMVTISAGVADHDSGESSSGASASAALGSGTLTVGYSQQTLTAAGTTALSANGDTTVLGATYAMSLDADTTIKVGYQSVKDGDSDSHSRSDLSISRSLGGGASVYLDLRSMSGDMTTDGSAVGFGTTVSF